MAKENIKIGEIYFIRAQVIGIGKHGTPKVCVLNHDIYCCPHELHPIPSEPPTLVGLTPKYDPCREFREGDKVELKTNCGRNPFDTFYGQEYIPDGTVFTVLRDEWAGGKVDIFEKDESDAFTVHFSNLELVTPVEEKGPYFIEESTDGATIVLTVKKRDCSQGLDFRYCPGWGGNIFFSENHFRKHAEAERDRLNAEYRKDLE